ncbi:MAG: hypothetical protein GYB65_13885, partial [Chloroflexi bacterium]|nr:hypothetical protein [Chloroflexota bacterium]
MSNVQRIQLGPQTAPLHQGRSAHGRWRHAYQPAGAPLDEDNPVPAALVVVQDADRLVFALTDGPAAAFLSDFLVDYLWTRESTDDDWPENLRSWLSDTSRWAETLDGNVPDGVPEDGVPDGPSGFICGRLERNVAGGRIYLAWLGMNGVVLLDRAGEPVTLDTVLETEECWTAANGPEPVGMALHAHRASLFGLDRLLVFTASADPIGEDLPDLGAADLQHALEDWSEETDRALALFDLRLNPVLTEPSSVILSYRWVSPNLCELSWSSSSTATAYRVEESSTPGFEETTLVAELTDSRQVRYRFSPPATKTDFYRVVPINQGVEGTPSNAVTLTPMALTPPILEPVRWSEHGGYYLAWSPIEQASSYELQTAPASDFDPKESQIIYRGEVPTIHLSSETPPNQYYRVRALNALYAPNTPSPWSRVQRAPARLETPVFTDVTERRISWTTVPGARLYAVHVTPRGMDEDHQGETFYTVETTSAVSDVSATYRVRALRHHDDQRTASEWGKPVTVSPPDEGTRQRMPTMNAIWPVLLAAGVVALIVGLALGLGGMEVFESNNATATRTRIPEAQIVATTAVAQVNMQNAGAATQYVQTQVANNTRTAIATRWTHTPTPVDTATATLTPNPTETFAIAFGLAQTGTAEGFTATPSPTDTPDLTQTLAAGQTATATLWTPTPTPSETPDVVETFQAEQAATQAAVEVGQTATATRWTPTPTPSETPDPVQTFQAEQATAQAATATRLTATAAQWTPTPSRTPLPDFQATADAQAATRLTATATLWTPTLTPSRTPNMTLTLAAQLDSSVRATQTAVATAWTPTPSPTPLPDFQATAEAQAATAFYSGLTATA